MATLEDKILGEKLEYYCSSSEGSDDEDEDGNNKCCKNISSEKAPKTEWDGTSVNTGPKGVLRDWQRYKQLESEKREEQEVEKLELMKKLSLTCRSNLDEEKDSNAEDSELDKEFNDLLNDDYLKDYIKKRMEEMHSKIRQLPVFGQVINLSDGDEFLDAVDKEHKDVTVIIHIYENSNSSCDAMNGCLTCLAQEYPNVKFCKLKASAAGLSKHFKVSGVPALLIYKNGQLLGNFVRLGNDFGEDFYASDVESFLIDHGFLPDKTLIPSLIRDSASREDEDSDFDVD